ncbi:MAG TPA: hypothetical protein V6D23_19340, partial [Candidatus Obscuribacterales bacterium]
FAEGLAQYEAEFWAPEMDRLLRLHVLNRSMLTPAERNAFILLGNRGADGYNEGYSLVRFLFDTYGRERLSALLRNYREQNLSFDQALELTFGKPLLVLEAEWRQQLESEYRDQLRHRQESLNQAELLMPYQVERTWYQPEVSPDGKWIAYLSSGGYPTIRGQIYNIMPLKVSPLATFEAWGRQQKDKDAKEAKEASEASGIPVPTPEPTQPPDMPQPGFAADTVGIPDPASTPESGPTGIPSATPEPTPDPDTSPDPGPSPDTRPTSIPTASPSASPTAAAPAGPELKLEDFESELVKRLMDFRWRPDSQMIAYTTLKADLYGNSTTRVQLQPLKVNGQKLETQGDPVELDPERTTHSPAWSPDGKTLAVVTEAGGHDAVALYDSATHQQQRLLMQAPDWRQYRWLSFSPDGRQLLMEVFLPGQGQHLLRCDLATGMVEQLTRPDLHESDRQPVWAPDGKSLYFVSTRQGFADLWQLELESRQLKRLSQVYSGLETPSFGPEGKLYYARHHAQGTTLERVGPNQLKTYDQFNNGVGEAIFEQPGSLSAEPSLEFNPKDYIPWFGLEVVVPVVGRDEKGDQLGFLVQFTDLLQSHALNVLFLYGLASARIGYSAAYINRFFDTSFGLEVSDSPTLSFTTDGSQFFIQRDQHVSLFANRPLFNAGSGDTFATDVERTAGLEFTVSRQSNLTTQLGDSVTSKELREGWNNTLAFTFNDDRSRRKQRGFRYSLGVSGASRLFGSEYEYIAANAEWRHYIPTWAQQTLAYYLTGTAMAGETRPAILGGPPLSNVLVLNFQNIIPLRGFHLAELQGPMLLAGSLEYRVPILDPIVYHVGEHYIENITGAVFVDFGDAWYPSKRLPFPHIGAGLELRSELILSRRNSFQLYLGAGKALLGEGANFLTDRPIEFYGGFANVF